MSISSYKLRIVEYFDSIISEVDCKAETLLVTLQNEQQLINEKRKAYIDEIKHIEEANLVHLSRLDLKSISDEHDEERVNEKIFPVFCFLISDMKCFAENKIDYSEVDIAFGYLIILDQYFSKEKLSIYKEFVKNIRIFVPVNEDSPLFTLRYAVCLFCFFYYVSTV